MKIGLKIVWFALVLILGSCSSDDSSEPCSTPGEGNYRKGVFILNEGNFTFGNGSVDFYQPENKTVFSKVFETENGIVPGDVVQSLAIVEETGYLVVNNSQKIEVIDLPNMKVKATITGFNSPRFLLPLDAQRAYVSDLYQDQINIVNLESNTVVGNIPIAGWIESMLLVDGKVWACNKDDKNKIVVIDPAIDKVVDSIALGVDPNDLLADGFGNIWACGSSPAPTYQTWLYKINPNSLQIEESTTFSNNQPFTWLAYNSFSESLLLLSHAIYEIDVTATGAIQAETFLPESNNYSIGIDPTQGDVYIGNAKDFLQEGEVVRLSSTGTELDRFETGIIPGRIVFFE